MLRPMARPRSFDPEVVLDAARDVFWAHGYQGAAYEQITAATGLKKPSLYAAFGDKAALFGAVLDRYQARLLDHAGRTLARHETAAAAVEAWLNSFVPVCSGDAGARGCLSLNTLLEGAGADPAIGARLDAYNARLETLLRERLEQGRAAGEFGQAFDPAAAAHAIIAFYTGLMALARGRPPADLTRAAILQALAVLRA